MNGDAPDPKYGRMACKACGWEGDTPKGLLCPYCWSHNSLAWANEVCPECLNHFDDDEQGCDACVTDGRTQEDIRREFLQLLANERSHDEGPLGQSE